MPQATLMYGIGATKAGTSWLYRYLDAHPECAMADPKELHYFDTLEFGKDGGVLQAIGKRLRALEARKEGASETDLQMIGRKQDALKAWAHVIRDRIEDDSLYLAHLGRGNEGARLWGDITPAYALLPETRLTQMLRLAPVTRFVYMLRDPVARLWSHIRMIASRKARERCEFVRIAKRLAQRVLTGKEEGISARSDYAAALGRLENAIPESARFVAFYEDLFRDDTLGRLCEFLGISPRPGNTAARVHAGAPLALESDMREAFSRHLAPQYAAVEARFGTLPEAWQMNLMKA